MAGIKILTAGKPSVFAHNANLGRDGRSGHPAQSYDQVDAVTFDDSGHRNKRGLQSNTFAWAGLFDSTAGRSYDVIKDMESNGRVVSYYADGTGAASTNTTPQQGIGYDNARAFSITDDGGPGDLLELSADIVQDGTYDALSLIERGTQTGASFASTWIELAAIGHSGSPSSTLGGRYYFHVLDNQAVGGNAQWIFTVQHASSTGAATVAATGATATYGSGTTQGTVLVSSGELRRYVRLVGTRDATTGTVDYIVGASRIQA